MSQPIITSLLDTDQYIYTMVQAMLLKYPNAHGEFIFKDRSGKMVFDKKQMTRLRDEIGYFCDLQLNKKELAWTSRIRYFQPFFQEYLRLFKPNREFLSVAQDTMGCPAILAIGPMSSVAWFEVPILRIISHIYCNGDSEYPWVEGKNRFLEKVDYIDKNIHRDDHGFKFSDFGTRRAYSPAWHDRLIELTIETANRFFAGSSNMMLAMKYGLTPQGTMSHWWLQAHQAFGMLAESQSNALHTWADVYQGDLGIALSDVVGFTAFLRDFNKYLAMLFEGARHDSGDPYDWGTRLIQHYQGLGINPMTKRGVFSDGLTFQLAVDLYKYFRAMIQTGFGIGTNYTNDLGIEAPRIVIKLVRCTLDSRKPMKPVAKISDSPGKGMCDDESHLRYLKQVFLIEEGKR